MRNWSKKEKLRLHRAKTSSDLEQILRRLDGVANRENGFSIDEDEELLKAIKIIYTLQTELEP